MRRVVFLLSAVLITSLPCVLFADSISLLTPNGGEELVAVSNYDITWQAEGAVENVFIEYSTDNGGDWNDVNTVPNSGSYEWTVPRKNSPQCLVRVSDANNPDVNDISDAMFRIYVCTLSYDLNHDCNVNMLDFALLASEYLQSGDPVPETMVFIPGGEFLMGDHFDEGGPHELPVHAVYVDSFYMSRYETTNQQYCDYLNSAISEGSIEVRSGIVYAAPGGTDPYCDTTTSSSYSRITWGGSSFGVVSGKEDHPMVMVSWYGSVAYCDYYGYRLPTEAEREYAARGGEHNPYYRYPWGDSIDGSKANYWDSADPYETGAYPWTTPVGYYDGGQIPAGTDMANGYGLYNMAGNVTEWCNDWHDIFYYSVSPYDNPQGPASGTYRVLRGGAWSHFASSCRVASRDGYVPDSRGTSRGFRVVLDFQ